MSKSINHIGLSITFILFGISYFTQEYTNYDFWNIMFLFWIAQGVYSLKNKTL